MTGVIRAARGASRKAQPDMLHEYAKHLAHRFATPEASPRVYADAWTALNASPRARQARVALRVRRLGVRS